jgi:DNA-binding response OmpR family regulator
MRALLVEDDLMLADGLKDIFAKTGYGLDHVLNAESALTATRLTHYDLLVVDLGLPHMDGITLIRNLRQAHQKMPILILSARDSIEDRVKGLNEGADDYMLKPFSAAELIARVQALIRRSQSMTQSQMTLGPLTLDTSLQEAQLHQTPLHLTRREWHLMEAMMLAAPKVIAKEKLADSLSQWDKEISINAVEIYISRLRSKLQGNGIEIRTLRGVGYRLELTHEQAP